MPANKQPPPRRRRIAPPPLVSLSALAAGLGASPPELALPRPVRLDPIFGPAGCVRDESPKVRAHRIAMKARRRAERRVQLVRMSRGQNIRSGKR